MRPIIKIDRGFRNGVRKACALRRTLRLKYSWSEDDRKFYNQLGEGIRCGSLAIRIEG